MTTVDRTTKVLLVVIALGVWLNAAITFGTMSAATTTADRVSLLNEWIIRGAPVSPR
jgi:hypothetical protein